MLPEDGALYIPFRIIYSISRLHVCLLPDILRKATVIFPVIPAVRISDNTRNLRKNAVE